MKIVMLIRVRLSHDRDITLFNSSFKVDHSLTEALFKFIVNVVVYHLLFII